MTAIPAEVFGLAGRGTLKKGNFADIVLFDPETVIDRADFDNPVCPADGIEMVFVNGACVYADGEATGRRPGRALRRGQG
jgi:N-acyl-D-amino-acid deacylase